MMATTKTKAGARALFVTALLIVFVDAIGAGMALPVFPYLVTALGGGPLIVTQLIALSGLCTFLASPWIGRVSDVFGRKRVIQGAQVGAIAAFLGMLSTWSLPGLFVFRALGGAMNSREAVVQALATDAAVVDHVNRIGWLSSARGVGMALGPALGGALGFWFATPQAHYRAILVAAMALGVGALLSASLFLPRAGSSARARSGPLDWTSLRACLAPIATSAVITYVFWIILSVTALFAMHVFGWRLVNTAWLLTLSAATVATVRLGPAQWITARLGAIPAYRAALALAAMALTVLALAKAVVTFIVAFIALNLAYGVGLIVSTGIVAQRAPTHARGQALGLNQSAGACAGFIGASVNGVLFEGGGPHAPFAAGAALVAAYLAADLWFRLGERR